MSNAKSFWGTLPGILTAVAAVLTAAAGLIAALHGAGVFSPKPPPPVVFDRVTKLCPEIAPYCTRIGSNDNPKKAAIYEEKCRLWARSNGWRLVGYTSVNGKAACVLDVPRKS